ncbi:MAG TPA: hypothetical protein VKG89_04400 [Solirubrobacterales bacterium]|nr:hypothetical protein [Solirubrobacterales bacterium]
MKQDLAIDSHPRAARMRSIRARKGKLALVLATASLAVPATAVGYTDPGAQSTGHDKGGPAAGAPSRSDGNLTLRRDGSTAVPFVPAGTQTIQSSDDGFAWGDAMIGAGAALGLVAIGGAGLTVRRRGGIHPQSVPSSS